MNPTSKSTPPPGTVAGKAGTRAAPRSSRKSRIIVLAVVLALAVGAVVWKLAPSSRTFYTDADRIRESSEIVTPRDILWQPPTPLSEVVNSPADDYEPRVSADGMTLFFVRGKAGENADIFVSRRIPTFDREPQGSASQAAPADWSDPEPLSEINSSDDDLGPEPSADGAALYFYSNRPGGSGGYDLWVAYRGADGWLPPVNLGPQLNSPFNDYGPALTPDGLGLYFASNRPQPQDAQTRNSEAWPATIREDLFTRDYDLFQAEVTERGTGDAAPVSELNTPHNEGAPAVSPAGDFLYFASDRPGGFGGFDLYRARRLRGDHLSPARLDPPVNSAANELDPALGLGGFALHFSSDHRIGSGPRPGKPDYGIYHTTSREVFTEREVQHADIDWAGLWANLGPNVLWALLSLLVLLALLRFLGGLRSRKLSLLMRCLLASVFLHSLLLFLLTFWKVTASIAGAIQARGSGGGGGIQVAFAPSGDGGGIAGQILGGFTDVRPEPIHVAALQMPATPNLIDLSPQPANLTPAPQTIDARAVPLATLAVHEASPAHPERPRVEVPTDELIQAQPFALKVPQTAQAVQTGEADIPSALTAPTPKFAPATAELSLAEPGNQAVEIALAPLTQPTAECAPTLLIAAAVAQISEAAASPSQSPARLAALGPSAPPTEMRLSIPSAGAPPVQGAAESVPLIEAVAGPAARAGNAASIAADPAGTPFAALPPAQVSDTSTGIDAGSAPGFSGFATLGTAGGANWDAGASPAFSALTGPGFELGSPSGLPVPGLPENLALPGSNDASAQAVAEPAGTGPGALSLAAGPRGRAPLEPTSFSGNVSAGGLGPGPVTLAPSGAPDRIGANISLAGNSEGIPDATPAGMPRISEQSPGPGANPDALPGALALDIRVPTELLPPENPYAQRQAEEKQDIVNRMGGSEKTERGVAAALVWLAEHQSRDGRWDGNGFDRHCGECGGETDLEVDVGLTGLSLLCFLGANHTHQKDGPYRDQVDRAVSWLISLQSSDGDLRRDETMYSHGIAAIALSEAYGMTRDARLEAPVQRAIQFIEEARNPTAGGWRYDPGQAGDTSVLGWQVMALKSAQLAGIKVNAETFAAAAAWLEKVSSPSRPGLYAYQPQRKPSHAMTAEGMFVQQLLGRPHDEPRMIASAAHLAGRLPDWNATLDTYYWYYATMALYQHSGDGWEQWNEALTRELLAHQVADGRPTGSWAPRGKWADKGGRVYQTALCTLMLEVYYRYLPLYSVTPGDSVAKP